MTYPAYPLYAASFPFLACVCSSDLWPLKLIVGVKTSVSLSLSEQTRLPIPCSVNPMFRKSVAMPRPLGEAMLPEYWALPSVWAFPVNSAMLCISHPTDVLLQVFLPQGQILPWNLIIRALNNIIGCPSSLKYPWCLPNASVLASEELIASQWTSPCRRWSWWRIWEEDQSKRFRNCHLCRNPIQCSRELLYSSWFLNSQCQGAWSVCRLNSIHPHAEISAGSSELCKSLEAAKLGQEPPMSRVSYDPAPSKLLWSRSFQGGIGGGV